MGVCGGFVISDIYLKRETARFHGAQMSPASVKLFGQVARIVETQVIPLLADRSAFFKRVHEALTAELGWGQLSPGTDCEDACSRFICEPYSLWNDAHRDLDFYMKTRLSLIELIFRDFENEASRSGTPWRRTDSKEKAQEVIRELNHRLHESGLGLRYVNGRFLREDDSLTCAEISTPFWEILQDPRWSNVDRVTWQL